MKSEIKYFFFSIILLFLTLSSTQSLAQVLEEQLPITGFTIGAPRPSEVGEFVEFIENHLSKTNVNTLFLMVNYKYQFKSYPELAEPSSLSENDVKELVNTCKRYEIAIVPLINLLGHQSWKQDNIKSLLRVYPQFEENPGEKLLEKDFYCRSYCPLHPKVHEVVFSLVDELIDVFQAKAVHVGMDEVFVLGEDSCERCKGKNKAKLFGDEVNKIYKHLESKGVDMYMWGDRLIDGKITGLGKWSASYNDTHEAIDLISKNIIICDWQYKSAPPTPAYFIIKGFKVIACSFEVPKVAKLQLENTLQIRRDNKDTIKNRMLGVMHTYWSTFGSFIKCYDKGDCNSDTIKGAVETFKTIYEYDK